MKAVMISIHPEWCEKILSGKKTIEIRKNCPKLATPFKVYIYCTKNREFFMHGGIRENSDDLYRMPDGETRYGYSVELALCDDKYGPDNFLNGKVIAEFTCDRITCLHNVATCPWSHLAGDVHEYHKHLVVNGALMSERDLHEYCCGAMGYAWHISGLKIYERPREISDFWVEKNQTYGCPPLVRMSRAPQSWYYVAEMEASDA